jgi:hypothetical protein
MKIDETMRLVDPRTGEVLAEAEVQAEEEYRIPKQVMAGLGLKPLIDMETGATLTSEDDKYWEIRREQRKAKHARYEPEAGIRENIDQEIRRRLLAGQSTANPNKALQEGGEQAAEIADLRKKIIFFQKALAQAYEEQGKRT